MCEILFSLRRYVDLLYLTCYCYLQPALVQANLSEPFHKLLYMATIHSRHVCIIYLVLIVN